MVKRRHLSNGRTGELAREVLLFEDSGQWLVEDQHGGPKGPRRRYRCENEVAAYEQLERLQAKGDGWRQLR